jgi:hypothetical protein
MRGEDIPVDGVEDKIMGWKKNEIEKKLQRKRGEEMCLFVCFDFRNFGLLI